MKKIVYLILILVTGITLAEEQTINIIGSQGILFISPIYELEGITYMRRDYLKLAKAIETKESLPFNLQQEVFSYKRKVQMGKAFSITGLVYMGVLIAMEAYDLINLMGEKGWRYSPIAGFSFFGLILVELPGLSIGILGEFMMRNPPEDMVAAYNQHYATR